MMRQMHNSSLQDTRREDGYAGVDLIKPGCSLGLFPPPRMCPRGVKYNECLAQSHMLLMHDFEAVDTHDPTICLANIGT